MVAMDFQYELLRINKKVMFQSDSHLQLAVSAHITNRDVAVAISYSGNTKEVNLAIEEAKVKNNELFLLKYIEEGRKFKSKTNHIN